MIMIFCLFLMLVIIVSMLATANKIPTFFKLVLFIMVVTITTIILMYTKQNAPYEYCKVAILDKECQSED